MKKEGINKVNLIREISRDLFCTYIAIFIIYFIWFVASIFLFDILQLFLPEKISVIILQMLVSSGAGIAYLVPLVMVWDIILFSIKNQSEKISVPELLFCALNYGIDCYDKKMIKDKSFGEICATFQNKEPFLLKRMKRNFLWSMIFGLALIIAIHKIGA